VGVGGGDGSPAGCAGSGAAEGADKRLARPGRGARFSPTEIIGDNAHNGIARNNNNGGGGGGDGKGHQSGKKLFVLF